MMGAELLAAGGVVGVIVTVVALGILHRVSTLSPVRDAVSAYGISPYRWLYHVQTLATAFAAAALAAAVAPTTGAAGAVTSLAVLALFRAVIGWFPMDAPGTRRTATGRIHNLLAFGAFAAASTSGFLLAGAFSRTEALAAFAPVAAGIGWFTSAAAVLTLIVAAVPAVRGVFGLVERLVYVGMLALLAFGSAAVLFSA
jgi:hypothetical protein